MMQGGSTSHVDLDAALVEIGLSAPERTRAISTLHKRLGLDPAEFMWHTSPGTREAAGAESLDDNNVIWVTGSSVTLHPLLGVTVPADGHRPNGYPRYNFDGTSYVPGSRGSQHQAAPEPAICPKCFLAHAGDCI